MAIKGKPEIDRERCKGCLLCVRPARPRCSRSTARPIPGAITPSTRLDEDKCIACGNCYQVCPDVAITVYRL